MRPRPAPDVPIVAHPAMLTSWTLDPALDFLRQIWAIDHRLERASKRMAVRLGVTGPQRFVLRIVQRFPDISPGELAHAVQLHPSTLTGVLRRLEQKRFLVREPDPADGRRALLRVRDKAARLTASPAGTVESAVSRALANLTAEAIEHTRHVLQELARALDEEEEGFEPPRGAAARKVGRRLTGGRRGSQLPAARVSVASPSPRSKDPR